MSTLATATKASTTSPNREYVPRGGALRLLTTRDGEVLIDGPANTGKSYAGLWKMHLAAIKYPGMHGLLLRKTLVGLKSSTLVTFRERVLGDPNPVRYWSAKADEAAHYAYPNGSKLYVGGMDNASKIMSTEYDMAFVDEATDLTVDEWEALGTRIRFGVMPYQQLMGACNPGPPTHWLNQRCESGRTSRVLSRHDDNPNVTADYLRRLDQLTGVRRSRLLLGLWAAAEGMVYEESWSRERNVMDRRRVTLNGRTDLSGDCGIPREWPRYLSIDFGFTHPFVCQWWAEDDDGRLYRYREIYRSHTLVEDHARAIREASGWGKPSGDPLPRLVICDHDAEDRATLSQHLGLHTTPAHKTVSDGIQAVAARLRPAADGRARLFFLRDSLVATDPYLLSARQPTCTEDEVESYIWALNAAGKREQPVKESDHGLDAARYMVAERDLGGHEVTYGPVLF